MKSFSNKNGFILFLKKYGIFILIGIILLIYGIPFVVRTIKRQNAKTKASNVVNEAIKNDAQNSSANPVVITQKSQSIIQKYPNVSKQKHEEVKASAQRIAYALGTNVQDNYMWRFTKMSFELFNVRAWTEDEEEAVRIASKHTGTFPLLELYYYQVFTNSKNLKHDLLNLLSKKDLDKIRASHLKYGGYRYL